ncbi:hypothetical protein EH233_23805 [Anabaena sp. YBS01]|nr:hypothetical protein EH233_23805 [Anabaena sp. YBS01]
MGQVLVHIFDTPPLLSPLSILCYLNPYKNEVQTLTETSTPEFDPLKFFEEVGLPVEAKKSVQPKTIQDLRSLTQHLFKRQPNQATA